jgi:hypothetical protein
MAYICNQWQCLCKRLCAVDVSVCNQARFGCKQVLATMRSFVSPETCEQLAASGGPWDRMESQWGPRWGGPRGRAMPLPHHRPMATSSPAPADPPQLGGKRSHDPDLRRPRGCNGMGFQMHDKGPRLWREGGGEHSQPHLPCQAMQVLRSEELRGAGACARTKPASGPRFSGEPACSAPPCWRALLCWRGWLGEGWEAPWVKRQHAACRGFGAISCMQFAWWVVPAPAEPRACTRSGGSPKAGAQVEVGGPPAAVDGGMEGRGGGRGEEAGAAAGGPPHGRRQEGAKVEERAAIGREVAGPPGPRVGERGAPAKSCPEGGRGEGPAAGGPERAPKKHPPRASETRDERRLARSRLFRRRREREGATACLCGDANVSGLAWRMLVVWHGSQSGQGGVGVWPYSSCRAEEWPGWWLRSQGGSMSARRQKLETAAMVCPVQSANIDACCTTLLQQEWCH